MGVYISLKLVYFNCSKTHNILALFLLIITIALIVLKDNIPDLNCLQDWIKVWWKNECVAHIFCKVKGSKSKSKVLYQKGQYASLHVGLYVGYIMTQIYTIWLNHAWSEVPKIKILQFPSRFSPHMAKIWKWCNSWFICLSLIFPTFFPCMANIWKLCSNDLLRILPYFLHIW